MTIFGVKVNKPINSKAYENTTVFDYSIITLPRNHMKQGNLTVVENNKNVLFDVKLVYMLYDMEGSDHRNCHVHKEL